MRTKKLLSIILTLCLVFTTIGSLSVVNAQDVTITETYNVTQGAECILPDGTVVDTTYPGYQIISGTDGNTYRVNIGTYGVLLYDDMENHTTKMNEDGTGTNTFGSAFNCAFTTTDIQNAKVYDVSGNKEETATKSLRFLNENSNTFLSVGKEASQYTNWDMTGTEITGRRISFKLKIADFKFLEGRAGENQAINIRADGKDWLLIRLYPQYSTGDKNGKGFNFFAVKTYTTATASDINIYPTNKYDVTINLTEDTASTDWIDFEAVFDSTNKDYDLYINGISAATDVAYENDIYSDGITTINLAKRSNVTHAVQTYIDDLKITDNTLVYPSAINGENLTDSVYSGVNSGSVSVPVTMSDDTTQNFTATYTLTDAQTAAAGTYNVEATIPGFSEKVTVAVTVNETVATDKMINTHQNAVYTFPTTFDSMAVTWKNYAGETVTAADTTVIGRKYYTGTIADGRAITYTVNVGSYDSGIADSMENHRPDDYTLNGASLPWITMSTPAGINTTLTNPTTNFPGTITTKTENVDGVDNQYVIVGPDATNSPVADWNIVDSGFDNGFHVSYKLKLDSVTEFYRDLYTDEPNDKMAAIKVAMDGANGEIGYIVIQLGDSATSGNNLLRAYGDGAISNYISINNLIKSKTENEATVYYTDWMQIDIYGYDDGFDVSLNGTRFAERIPYSHSGAGELAGVRIEKRDHLSNRNDVPLPNRHTNAVTGFDDLTIRRFKCFTGELASPLNLTVPVGAESTDIDLVLGNGDSQKFNVTFNADTDKIANLSNVDATIEGFDGTVKANVKVCNYDVDGVNLKNGSEFVTAPVAGGALESAKITRLTDAVASQAIFVLYSQNDEIKAIKTVDISSLAKGAETVVSVGMTLPENTATGDYIKVYVWDSKANIQPLDMVTDLTFDYGVAPAVYFAGDSTACDYPTASATTSSPSQWPKAGVGQVFSNFYNGNVTNLAKSGATTQTFINDGLWGRIINNVKTGDYVIISFGHNDQDYCLTEPCFFKTNLQKFINEARSEGANVLMYSPISRRGQEGNANRFEPGGDHQTHMADLEYICTTNKVPFIDMEDISATYLNGLSSDASAKLYMIDLVSNKSEYASNSLWATSRYNPDGKNDVAGYTGDNTHFNLYGAKVYTQMLVKAISEQYPDIQLTKYLKNLTTTITHPALD